jgi:hypothetical protein
MSEESWMKCGKPGASQCRDRSPHILYSRKQLPPRLMKQWIAGPESNFRIGLPKYPREALCHRFKHNLTQVPRLLHKAPYPATRTTKVIHNIQMSTVLVIWSTMLKLMAPGRTILYNSCHCTTPNHQRQCIRHQPIPLANKIFLHRIFSTGNLCIPLCLHL